VEQRRRKNSLSTVAIISLHKHNLLRDYGSLFWCHEAKNATRAGVRLLVAVCDAHATAYRDVKASKPATLIDNGNEANIIRKDIDIICWRYRDCNFELKR
jgi:hypothetical protein